jgi:hypothetical protein
MIELLCRSCGKSHWEIDHDYRGAELIGQKELPYSQRTYYCQHCQCTGSAYSVLQKSPPELFLQPHPLYPMNRAEFEHWVTVLKQNFPDYPMLTDLYKTWYPNGSNGRLRSHGARLLRRLLRLTRMRVPKVR